MNSMPFSVSMCVYGGDVPEYFRLAAESILHQTLPPDEVVLVVDGPVPEELGAVIAEFEQNPVFRVLRLPENTGHGNARRTGLAACTHDLVALMDADDIARPDRFEKQIAAFSEDPALTIVGGQILEFSDTPQHPVSERQVRLSHAEIAGDMKRRCPFNQMTVMFRKADVEEVGGYLDWYCEEDYYLWARLLLAGKQMKNLPDVLVDVRVGCGMYGRRGGWKYYRSERDFQRFLWRSHIISWARCQKNIARRFVVQVLLPTKIRGFIFRKFARKPVKTDG